MGISFLSKNCGGISSGSGQYVSMSPNPKNFKILNLIELENTYAEIHYPDCKNYEGVKIVVFEGKVADKLLKLTELDPHFSTQELSPIARFKPDNRGKYMALQICKGDIWNHH
jgi:hypothetical protein